MKNLVKAIILDHVAAVLAALALVAAAPAVAQAQDRMDGGIAMAFVGDVPLSTVVTPAGPLGPGDPFSVELRIDAGAAPLGAYSLDFRCDESQLQFVSVSPGTATQLSPISNTSGIPCGANLVAFNASSLTEPTGQVSIAVIQMQVAAGATAGTTLFSFLDASATTADDLDTVGLVVPANDGVEVVVCGDGNVHASEACDDGNLVDGDCCSATCTLEADGAVCDDGSACTDNDVCSGGTCAGAAITCDDGNACTDDTCDPATGCASTNNTASCDDGSACTENDVCGGGTCAGTAISCDDSNGCTDDTCNPATGCVSTNNTASCDDGNACTQNDTCAAGACVSGTAVTCDDGNACTDDTCNPATGCVTTNNTASCDDGNACTQNDTCSAGSCVPGAALSCDDSNGCTDDTCDPASGCQNTNNTSACDDGNLCTENDVCSAGSCSGSPKDCSSLDAGCAEGICDAATGSCVTSPIAEGDACDDGAFCTTGEVCTAGVCAGGVPTDCSAQSGACSEGSCNETTDSCDSNPINEAGACDDGSACTENDVCSAGTCAGTAINCDDSNECTTDTCDAATGCVNANNTATCDDGSACTENDVCGGGTCAGTAISCDDSNECTTDTCDAATGCANTNNTAACDDGDGCTENDVCADGVCTAGSPRDCNDGNACTADSCVAGECVNAQTCGALVSLQLPAQDPGPGQAFEAELLIDTATIPLGAYAVDIQCDAAVLEITGAVLPGAATEFANSANLVAPCDLKLSGFQAASATEPHDVVSVARIPFAVKAGAAFGATTTIDLSPTLVADTSGASLGAIETDPVVTVAASVCGDGIVSGVEECDDRNVLDGDCCSADCTFEIGECEDGTNCTVGDTCQSGVCVPGAGPDCADGLNCTLDDCDAPGGNCVNTPITCDDLNGCTLDECDEDDGCENTPIVSPCDDGDACTEGDACDAVGECVGAPVVCDDGNDCTTDTCLAATGCVVTPNANPCDDGNVCTDQDTCAFGSCVGVAVSCDDNDPCTVDSCAAPSGCLNEPVVCDLGECAADTGECVAYDLFCFAASDAESLQGAMAVSGDFADGADADAERDSLSPALLYANSTKNSFSGGSGDAAHYGIRLPDEGPWYAWARLYYPGTPNSNEANSFFLSVDGGAPAKLGNNKDFFQQWHWDGNGAIENGPVASLSLGALSAGTHSIVIEKREVVPDGSQPRLDIVCLSRDGENPPSDVEVAEQLGLQDCTVDAECEDGDGCTINSCVAGSCTSAPRVCDDNDACTSDACEAGECVNAPITCDNGDACDGLETCDPVSGCVPGTPVNCIDGNACTDDYCESGTGACSNPAISCDDNNLCTVDTCDATFGCSNEALVCADGETCNPATGLCDASIVCVAAADPSAVFSGKMTTGVDYTAGADEDPDADNLTTPLVFADAAYNSFNGLSNSTVSYVVELPDNGPWALWGRFYYPGAPGSNEANSFFVAIDDGAPLKLGNNKDYFQQWHWDGDGNLENGEPVGLELPGVGAGVHTVTVKKREATPVPPRLDVLCFTKDAVTPPLDSEVVAPE